MSLVALRLRIVAFWKHRGYGWLWRYQKLVCPLGLVTQLETNQRLPFVSQRPGSGLLRGPTRVVKPGFELYPLCLPFMSGISLHKGSSWGLRFAYRGIMKKHFSDSMPHASLTYGLKICFVVVWKTRGFVHFPEEHHICPRQQHRCPNEMSSVCLLSASTSQVSSHPFAFFRCSRCFFVATFGHGVGDICHHQPKAQPSVSLFLWCPSPIL